ncbi:tRNA threonylcarbamoyladenosine biosynthesis protein TsaE [Proteiniborus ethanoligenes]|uniref:tRNA threonylcarbamoyladenosine biosynthesis protein TsaE n=2 Tax=Proteiniborus ethanoligenes TaxID=415015 RepID=A0A1H3QXB3_9FIRM|nr:tRNA threonylcarbamoyladenosine biosynthesis protein TsaE [Proteiniborus ethanoligenes]
MKTLLKMNIDSIKETENLGLMIGKLLKGGEVICMTGDLGAGKTTLTQSIAKGLDIEDYVTSPTFTIINEYKGRCDLYHFDVYRIGDIEEMYDLGYEEYFYSDGVAIIEWADIIEEILPDERLNITISKKDYMDSREITIEGKGDKYSNIIKELEELFEAIGKKGVERI